MAEDDGQQASDEAADVVFPNVYAFVTLFLAPVYARRIRYASEESDKPRWCEYWWEHKEANSRLHGLWLAFEKLRHDQGTGLSVWWREHADPCMTQLMDPDGPFSLCFPAGQGTPGEHHVLAKLPSADIPSNFINRRTTPAEMAV